MNSLTTGSSVLQKACQPPCDGPVLNGMGGRPVVSWSFSS